MNEIIINYIHKRVKNLRITIKRDKTVMVQHPLFMDKLLAQQFVSKKMPWIKKHLKDLDSQRRYWGEGDFLYIWGKPYKKKICISSHNQVQIQDDTLQVSVKEQSQIDFAIKKFLRECLKSEALFLLEKWQRETGIKANELRIKDMKTRWGSCNIDKKRIWLNLRLVHYDLKQLEYVILHELMHIVERGHNKRFYSLLDGYMPDWKTSRKILRNQQPL
ncbi:MAG: SprT family zinc-dependent metalloprotease [Bacillota bacterium]|jgi:predicted metal-dependent hydrolase|nr:SprT family zinc-dependent metalloprotease [Bacillota bacterium]HHU43029.1 M48 family metallopeptidase [Clostridiales bacterium]